MKTAEVLACALPEWYPKFKKITYRSIIIPLDQEFVDYLLEDNLVLPEGKQGTPQSDDNSSEDSDSEEEDQVDWDEAERETPALIAPQFEELDTRVKQAIADLGGQVFVKLNWSSPQDAAWISLNSCLKCYTPSDIYLLLKSSDFITHDLTQPFKDCEDNGSHKEAIKYSLVLRRWVDINPGTEFRCFVYNRQLIGISQRDTSNFYFHISSQRSEIIGDIKTFFEEHIENHFSLSNYVFDVVRQCKDKVRLVDFNPYGPTTDSLLFDWGTFPLCRESDESQLTIIEVQPELERAIDFRFVTENAGVQPNPLRQYCVPRDFVDLCSGEDPFKLMDLIRLQTTNQGEESDDDD